MATIAILGYGTVGSGVLEVLRRNAASIERRAGQPVTVKYICDIRDFSSHPDAALFVNNIDVILSDPEVTAVALPTFHYQCLAMLLQPIIVVANMTFQSVGKAGRATFLACCRQGVFFIPLIRILPRTHGLLGVEICQPIADVCTFIVSLPFLLAFLRQLGRMDDAELAKAAS